MDTSAFTPVLEAFAKTLVESITDSLIERLPVLKGQEEERLLSPKEACQLFKPTISTSTLHEWASKGFIKNRKIGNRVWYRQSEIIEAGTKNKKYQRAI